MSPEGAVLISSLGARRGKAAFPAVLAMLFSASLARAQETTPPPSASTTGLSKIFNPDISVIGNFLGFAGSNDVDPQPSLALKESEIGLQAIVDPYARADFFLTFGSERGDVGVEEGYITFLNLPGDLLVKAGKVKGAFGKENTLHTHAKSFADVPLPILNLLGSEDGIEDAGIAVSRLIPAPAGIFLEGTAQLLRGSSDGIFEAHSRNDVEPLFHLKAYGDLTDDANVELGGSWTRGNGVEGPGFKTSLTGADLSFRWKPLRQGLYRSLLVRAEWFLSERDTPTGRVRADGFYGSAQWQLARRWFVSYRHDESDHADASGLRDRGNSVALTFWPSEFSQVRAQGRSIRYALPAGPRTATELLVQLQFAIGAHGAHTF
jgi:hypothetical protein